MKPKKESKKTSRTQRKNTQKPKAEESEITIIASDSHKKARPQHKVENSASTAPEENNSKSDKVYVTKSGKCYHSKQCGKGNFAQVTLEEAKTKGLKPCKRCFKNDTDKN